MITIRTAPAPLATLLLALALGLPATPALRAAPAAERFPVEITVAETPLVRNGVGLCEWGIFEINLYHAALWVEVPCSDPGKILAADAMKRIELEFCRKLSRKQMRKAYRTSFDANTTEEERKTHEKSIATFLETIDAVKKGERLTMTHLPGKGLVIEDGTRTIGPLGGDAFARLLFRLYLGEKPPTKQLRRQLLGDHPTPESLHRAKTKTADENAAKEEGAEKRGAPSSRPKTE